MPPRRSTSGDTRAAKTQLKVADQTSRVAKANRADTSGSAAVTVPLRDHEFSLAEDVGIMPLMEWAAATEDKIEESATSLIAVFHVLEDTVHPDEWVEFRKYCRDNKVQAKELGDFINAAMEAIAGRPTEEPSGS